MTKSMASIVCAIFALLTMIAGFFLTGVPIVGAVMAFLSPAIALGGIVLGGIGMSEAKKRGQGEGGATTGLIINIIAFILGLVVALTCGLCNACMTAGGAASAGAMGDAVGQLQQAAQEAQRQAAIQRQEEQEVLADLNALPDDWAGGAWSYQFSSFRCPAGSMNPCTLGATAQSKDTAGLSRPIRVDISPLTTQRDAQGDLTDELIAEVVRALGQWEDTEGRALLSPPSGSPSGTPIAPDPNLADPTLAGPTPTKLPPPPP